MASAVPWRIPAVVPRRQSSRVWFTISMMVLTPRPSSPTSHPRVPSDSTSEEAFARLPSLSFRRWMRKVLRVSSGRTRGTRKQESPPGACASARNASDIGAEQNHLCPRRTYPPSDEGSAVVRLARTSDPPCFSVIAMPKSAERLPGTRRGS